ADPLAQSAERLFARAQTYFGENLVDVEKRIAAAPAVDAGRPFRVVLEQCLAAILGEAGSSWPDYSFGSLDYMLLEFKAHDLLPPGRTARFIKVGTPVPTGAPVAFMILMQPEPGDDVAHELETAILARH